MGYSAHIQNGASYTSGADGYLRLLINQIIPKAESLLQGTPAWRGIAGYSLAGLFALYSIYQTDAFSRVASVSGSLWFPGIKEYVVSRTPVKNLPISSFRWATGSAAPRIRF